jgi:hypothetical protein
MATPADQRMLELMEKWLKSLELHAKYSSLDDDSYWKIQPWVEHQRPSRWIIDLAMQKTIALRTQVEQRIKMADAQYSDSLELMIFLANLVGSEHIERFIPVADAHNERALERHAPESARPPTDATTTTVAVTATATREMPKFVAAKRPPAAAGTATMARTERRAAPAPRPAAKPALKPPARPPPVKAAGRGPSDIARAQVVADAIRLVQWGRKWYELPELIARMADRPSLPDVRRILKENKADIDAKAGG